MNVKPLFKLMVEKKASDLFFAPFAPAKIKIDGKIMPVNKLEMTPKMVKQAAIELMDDEMLETFTRELEIDFAKETTPRDKVAVIATSPLTRDEVWERCRRGEFAVFRAGERVL